LLDKTLQVPLGRHRNRLEFQLQAFRQFGYNVLLFGNAPNHTINENRSAYSNETIVQTKSDDIKNSDLIPHSTKIQKALKSEAKKTGTNWTAAFDGLYNNDLYTYHSVSDHKRTSEST